MASQRNNLENLITYIESLGIDVNLGKNKARGNKGFFKATSNSYRIDISKSVDTESRLSVLIHEFAHYLHYKNDPTLQSLNFIFEDGFSSKIEEELIEVTVNLIPKKSIEPLFNTKENIETNIRKVKEELKQLFPNTDFTTIQEKLTKIIEKTPYKHLLKHDNVKILNFMSFDIFSIKNVEQYNINESCKKYLYLCSQKRALKRINSKIYKLNKYYNSKAELFARSLESFFLNRSVFAQKAPIVNKTYENLINKNKIKMLSEINKILVLQGDF
ncbi:hypothetical protein IJD34_01525 [bacterium]|nr:hypothetical protein [bacterium]